MLDCLNNGYNCVFDATNLVKKRRIELLKMLPENTETEIVVMATEFEVILKQNAARERNVPDSVYKRMVRIMTLPQDDEGWDKITYHRHPQNCKSFEDYEEMCKGFNQSNPHHSLDLYSHCAAAANFVRNNYEEYNLDLNEAFLTIIAAQLHDIGKLYTRTHTLWSGKEDNMAHYYNHAEIGAYLILCCVDLVEENQVMKNTVELVRLHMNMYNEGIFKKIREKYGERFMLMAKCLHDADVVAH